MANSIHSLKVGAFAADFYFFMTPTQQLHAFRKNRREVEAIMSIDKPQIELAVVDEIEEGFYQKALLDERLKAEEVECWRQTSKPSIFLQFTAGDLRNPATLASLIEKVKR